MTRLLLARHAATDWNAVGRYQGHQDIALGAVGRQQAARLATRLAAEPIDRIIASDLSRAQETARAVAELRRLPVHRDPRLRELHFGAWEGLTYSELQHRHPAALTAWQADPSRIAPPGGETVIQLAERVYSFLSEVRAESKRDRAILVVGHNGSLQMLLCLALGLPPESRWKFRLEPASLSELHLYDEGGVLTRLNDTHHLPESDHAR
jgi:alpha-ribazole phosphatase